MTKWLTIQAVCERYNDISQRTVDRWVVSKALPPPVYIRRRRYWDEADLDQRDEARKAAAIPQLAT